MRDRLASRAQEQRVSQADVIAEALEALEQREFWSAVDAGYERLRQDPEAWSDYVNERDEWVNARLVEDQK